jgi:hypothetical protein
MAAPASSAANPIDRIGLDGGKEALFMTVPRSAVRASWKRRDTDLTLMQFKLLQHRNFSQWHGLLPS